MKSPLDKVRDAQLLVREMGGELYEYHITPQEDFELCGYLMEHLRMPYTPTLNGGSLYGVRIIVEEQGGML